MAAQTRTERPVDRTQERRQLEAARKREGILEASARAFARGGYRATTMQDIAREAGYTPPSLYAYFDSKEQIFLELAALLSREFTAVFDEPLPAQLPFRERLQQLLHRLYEKADRHRDAVSVFLMARLSGEALIGREMAAQSERGSDFSSVQAFVVWLRRNAKRSELGGRSLEELGVALAGLAHAFCIQWLSKGSKAGIAGEAARVTSLFLHGALGDAAGRARTSSARG